MTYWLLVLLPSTFHLLSSSEHVPQRVEESSLTRFSSQSWIDCVVRPPFVWRKEVDGWICPCHLFLVAPILWSSWDFDLEAPLGLRDSVSVVRVSPYNWHQLSHLVLQSFTSEGKVFPRGSSSLTCVVWSQTFGTSWHDSWTPPHSR